MPLFASRPRTVTVADPLDSRLSYLLPVSNRRTAKRAAKMGSKEPGTVAWLHREVRPDDVVWDVGANVGIYTLFAAARAPRGQVVAFEPHGPNFQALLQAIAMNGKARRIMPVNMALDGRTGYIPFLYRDLVAGSTGSQLGTSPLANKLAGEADDTVTELKHAVSADQLLASAAVPAPNLVKIDVDGNEANILRGMSGLLAAGGSLRQVQVEVDPDEKAGVLALMAAAGWQEQERHLSRNGERHLAAGGDPDAWPVNIIFAPS